MKALVAPLVRTLAVATGLLVGLGSDASAQASVGLKAGIAVADVRGSDPGDHSSRSDVTAGFFVDIGPSEGPSLQLEVNVVPRGTVERNLDDGLGTTYARGSWEYRYLDLAALPKYSVGVGGGYAALYAGPYLGTLTLLQGTLVTEGEEIPVTGRTKKIDLGGVVGVSFESGMGVLIDVRYMTGFSDFDDNPFDRIYSRRHAVIAVMIGMTWG